MNLTSLSWTTDELGGDYRRATLSLGRDPDGEGQVSAVLVQAPAPAEDRADHAAKPALLWVHGMSDYFFQDHVAAHYTAKGYPFYALDLRKCGRAHKEGQRWHYTTDMRYYFDELTMAAKLIAEQHGAVIPIAHSTGGLIIPLWIDHLRRHDPQTHALVIGQILNSPWVDMQFPSWVVKMVTPVVNIVGKRFPLFALPSIGESTYGQSIYKGAHGQWEFDTEKKALGGHKKFMGWFRAVLIAQQEIHAGAVDVAVPTLTLCSSQSYLGKPYSAQADQADTVLDVEQIQRWAPELSSAANSSTEIIDGALHDVFLSAPDAREQAFAVVDEWLAGIVDKRKGE